jgi:AP-2 complex subunit mu-1
MEVSITAFRYLSTAIDNLCRIPRVQGGQEITFNGTAQLTSTTTRQVWARPPIDVDFQVLMFTSSGLVVRFLKVFEKSNYHSIKWVRYLTKASGTYQIRVSRCGFPGNITLMEPSLLDRSFSGS